MPELNLKQIINKLNAEFTGNTRKLVFWYDEKAEFVDDINALELVGAKVYRLEPENEFNHIIVELHLCEGIFCKT